MGRSDFTITLGAHTITQVEITAPDPFVLPIGSTCQITVTVTATRWVADGTNVILETFSLDPVEAGVTYTSDATGVATVSSTGLVTGQGAGDATITVSAGGLTDLIAFTISNTSTVASVEVTPTTWTLQPSGTVTVAAIVRNAQGQQLFGKTVTWASDASSVASVGADSGTEAHTALVTAGASPGTANIRATCNSIQSSPLAVTVTAASNEPVGYQEILTENFDNPSIVQVGGSSYKRYTHWHERGGVTYVGTTGWPDSLQITPTTIVPAPVGTFDVPSLRNGTLDNYVAAIQVPQGWNPGGSEAPSSWSMINGFGSGRTEIYIRMRFQLSSNYAHWNGSKIGYIYCGSAAPIFFALVPIGSYTTQVAAQSRPVKIRAGLQGVVPQPSTGWPSWNAEPNMGTSSDWYLNRGQVDLIEIQCIGNTVGVADGILRMWLRGVQIMEYTDVGYWGGDHYTIAEFSRFSWTPTHDDFGGDDYDFSVYQSMDQFYCSAP